MVEKRRVWDLPLRMFHWLLVLNIAASWYTAENGEEYLNVGDRAFAYIEIHFFLGYLALALVAFRIIWGFVGPKHARFSSFLAGPKKFFGYAGTVLRRDAKPSIGHNPLGGWMVALMLAMIGSQAFTGLFMIDSSDIYPAIYHGAVSSDLGSIFGRFHHINFDVLLWVISLHVLAIVFYAVYKRQNLVHPMVTGKKLASMVPEHEAIASSQLLKALIVALICAGGIYAMIKLAPPPAAVEEYY
ncbi:MAG: cytochrome b/b6 domain-containing protein [Steroidobacteraceae bacterium]